VWGDQERWLEARRALSNYLLEAADNGDVWAGDTCFTRLHRTIEDGQVFQTRECSPADYGVDIREPGHQGEDAEWHIAARAFDINVVALHRTGGVDGEVPSVERYVHQEPDQPNSVSLLTQISAD
jgi:hypothetical protein